MTKEEFVKALEDAGLRAEIDGSCVMALVPEITQAVQKTVTGIAEAEGYRGSYGWRVVRG